MSSIKKPDADDKKDKKEEPQPSSSLPRRSTVSISKDEPQPSPRRSTGSISNDKDDKESSSFRKSASKRMSGVFQKV